MNCNVLFPVRTTYAYRIDAQDISQSGDAPPQQLVDPRHVTRPQLYGIRTRSKFVSKPCGEEHDFSRLVARIVGAVAEMHARRFERPRDADDGGADGLARGARGLTRGASGRTRGARGCGCGADDFSGCVG